MTSALNINQLKVLQAEQTHLFILKTLSSTFFDDLLAIPKAEVHHEVLHSRPDEMIHHEISLLWLYSEHPEVLLRSRYPHLHKTFHHINLEEVYYNQTDKTPVETLLMLIHFILTQNFHLIILDGCLHDLSNDYPRLRWILAKYQVKLAILID